MPRPRSCWTTCRRSSKKLVEELIPSQISVTGVQRVLQTLLRERVSIRDLPAILEGIAEAVGHTKNALYITEHVRGRLARQLCHANLAPGGYLPLVALSPDWEQAFAESIVGQGEERQLAMAPSQLQQFIQAVRERFDEASDRGEVPVLLTTPSPPLRALHHRALPPADRGDEPERNPSPPCACARWVRSDTDKHIINLKILAFLALRFMEGVWNLVYGPLTATFERMRKHPLATACTDRDFEGALCRSFGISGIRFMAS